MYGFLLWFTMAHAAPTEVRVYGLGSPRAVQAVARTAAGPVIASCNDAKKGTDSAVDGTWTCDALALDKLEADILIMADSALLDAGRVKWTAGETSPIALVRVQGMSVSISTDKKLPAPRAGAVAAGPAATLVVRVLGYSGDGAPMVALGSSAGGQELSCRDDGRFPDRTMNDGQPTCLGAYLGLKTDVVIATGNGERVPFGTATWTGGAVRYLTLDVPTKRLSTRAFDLAFPGASSETAAKSSGSAQVAAAGTPTPTFVPKPGGDGAAKPFVVPKGAGTPTPNQVAKPGVPTVVPTPDGDGRPTPFAVPKGAGTPVPDVVAVPIGEGTPDDVADPVGDGSPTPQPTAPPQPEASPQPAASPQPSGSPKPAAMGSQQGGSGQPRAGGGSPRPMGPGGGGDEGGGGGSKLWKLGPWMFGIAVFFGSISTVRAWLSRPASVSPNMRRHSPVLPLGRDEALPAHGTVVSVFDGVGAVASLLDKLAPTTGVVLVLPEGVSPPPSRSGNVWLSTETEWDEVVECADALRRSGAGAVAVIVLGETTLTDAGAVVPAPFEHLSRAIAGWGSAILIAFDERVGVTPGFSAQPVESGAAASS